MLELSCFLTWGIPWVWVSRAEDPPSWPRAGPAESPAEGLSTCAPEWGRWRPGQKWSEVRDNDRSHLCVVVEATEKGCVEHKYSAQKFLVETKVPNLGENAVFGHGAVLWKILISGKDFYLWRWKVSFIVGSCCQLENILKTDLIRRQSWIVGCNDDIPVLYCTLGWGGGGEFSDRNFLWFAQRPGNQELLRHTDTAHHITVTLPR